LLALAVYALAVIQASTQADVPWPVNGGVDNIRYSALTQINKDNVNRMQVAWTYDSRDSSRGSEMQSNPVVVDGLLYIVDAGAKEVVSFDLNSKARSTIACGLPVGPPPGVEPKPLKGMPPFSGPQGPFAGITMGSDGSLYVSADADGSVVALRRSA